MTKMFALVLALLNFTALSALADPQCTNEAKDKWKDQKTFKEGLVADGYKIKKFKVTKTNCYEIYGKNKAGKKVEIYFNPVTGDIVKENIDD